MGDLKRGVSHLWNSFKEGSKQIGEALGYEKAGVTPKSDKTKRAIAAAAPQVIPMPDEETLRRSQRKGYAGLSRSGRASTVLTQQDDTLG